MARSYPTRPKALPIEFWRRHAWGRRFLVSLFAIPIIGAAFGLVGLRHAEVTSEADGYVLNVRYPELSRAGISSPLDIYVSRPGGFDSPLAFEIAHDYFTLFDLNGIFPAPSAEKVTDGKVVWEFDPPDGDTFRVHVDWRVEPAVHRGTGGSVALLIEDAFITEVTFDTRLAP